MCLEFKVVIIQHITNMNEQKMKDIYSFDTPPQEGETFMVVCKNNHMILMSSYEEWKKSKDKFTKDEDIIGWKSVQIGGEPPPFMQPPFPKKQLGVD